MILDPMISYGSILNFLGVVGIGLVYLIRMEGKLNLFSLRIENLEDTMKSLVKNDTRISVIEERLASHGKMISNSQQDISDLRRGAGWIKNRDQVDGEYP